MAAGHQWEGIRHDAGYLFQHHGGDEMRQDLTSCYCRIPGLELIDVQDGFEALEGQLERTLPPRLTIAHIFGGAIASRESAVILSVTSNHGGVTDARQKIGSRPL